MKWNYENTKNLCRNEIEEILELEGKDFYYSNLKNGYSLRNKAFDVLFANEDNDIIVNIINYKEVGIFEYVASNEYHIQEFDNGTYRIEAE